MQAEQREYSPVTFPDAASAVAFAEEILSRAAPESQFAKLLRKSGGGDLSWEELRDIAHTISMTLARIQPGYMARVYRAVHGDLYGVRPEELVELIEACMRQQIPEAAQRSPLHCRVLAFSIIRRLKAQNDGKRYSNMRVAKDLGISRKTFDGKAWQALARGTEEMLKLWLARVDSNLSSTLYYKGIIA